ncbi:sugar ABC transporter ATP-binding protein [Cohnella laeviribosi]|uniref:sugar ABC transporter ATP-binding protein n=1 Tax=Cohnella laeviribosi TaxID=380174 RepID=UPI003D1C68A3
MESAPVLQLNGITKSFPGVKSLDNVHFELRKGEVHALVGENGAGKSTLMKIIGGVYKPDEGEIVYRGQIVQWQSPQQARNSGISVIHQELKLAANLSIAENVLMGTDLPRSRFGFIRWDEINSRAKELLESIGSDLDPKRKVSTLSVAQQQIVEIARALSIRADVIIMDEPSATLTGKEIERLFALIRMLKARGVAIVYISHRMEEIFEISDRCTVLRDGQWIATKATKDTDAQELVRLMVGRDVSHIFNTVKTSYARTSETPLLETVGLSDGKRFADASLTLYPGEIVGISGLVGSGRSEFLLNLFGVTRAAAGEIRLAGKPVTLRSPRDAIRHGIALVPESRKEQALFLQLGVGENISVLKLGEAGRAGFIRRSAKEKLERDYREKLGIKTASLNTRIVNLSGGNQQKAIIARWLTIAPRVLLLDEPTRGVDVGAKEEIYSIIREMAASGLGIIVVSSDLPEILSIADRVYVMRQGRFVAELRDSAINQETIMLHATGGQVS